MKNQPPNYLTLSHFYEQCLDAHGATPRGVDWPNMADLIKRFKVMLGLIRQEPQEQASLLDLGCGYGAIVDLLRAQNNRIPIGYTGVDISQKMIDAAKRTYPDYSFAVRDILVSPFEPESFDYVIMNGLLTEKRSLSWNDMADFAKSIILEAFKTAKKGIAFNVMCYHVDWCNPSLFYWSFDDLTAFLYQYCSRHVMFRHDYGLYEYTAYVYKQPIS